MIRRALVIFCTLGAAVLFGAAGCGEDGNKKGEPDDAPGNGPDGGEPTIDGSPESGITIEFVYIGPDGEPVPPGGEDLEFPDLNFKIKQMTMQLHKVELVGDTAKPGDLVARSRVLAYPSSSEPRISFPSAPPGIYSRLDYRVERTYSDEELPPEFKDQRLSIRVRGEAFLDPRDRDFEYLDDQNIDIALDGFTEDIMPGQLGTIVVELDLAGWFADVDWPALADRMDEDDDDDGGGGGGDDDGEDDDDGGPGNGNGNGDELLIGLDGDQETADLMRQNLTGSFRVR